MSWRLFGDILPFLGWRRIPRARAEAEGWLDVLSPEARTADGFETFTIEWLTHGIVLWARPFWCVK